MATRRNLGGRYVDVRERNTSKGHKGTIIKNWSSKIKRAKKSKRGDLFSWFLVFLILVLLGYLIYIYFFSFLI